MMKVVVAVVVSLCCCSLARGELMAVEVKLVKEKAGGWSYVVSEPDPHALHSDDELAKYLGGLSNPADSIEVYISCRDDVPTDQLIKILGMVRDNPNHLVVKEVLLGEPAKPEVPLPRAH